jgi:hypothetical protein
VDSTNQLHYTDKGQKQLDDYAILRPHVERANHLAKTPRGKLQPKAMSSAAAATAGASGQSATLDLTSSSSAHSHTPMNEAGAARMPEGVAEYMSVWYQVLIV